GEGAGAVGLGGPAFETVIEREHDVRPDGGRSTSSSSTTNNTTTAVAAQRTEVLPEECPGRVEQVHRPEDHRRPRPASRGGDPCCIGDAGRQRLLAEDG